MNLFGLRRNQVLLLLLAVLFIAPGLAAYYFFKHPQSLGKTNKGTLLNPPILLSHWQASSDPCRFLTDGHGKSNRFKETAGSKWQLVLWSAKPCDEQCMQALNNLARARLALGRRLYNVELQLLFDANVPLPSQPILHQLCEQGIRLQRLDTGERARFPILAKPLKILIANPDDYLVLAYTPKVDPSDIFHDIKQLIA